MIQVAFCVITDLECFFNGVFLACFCGTFLIVILLLRLLCVFKYLILRMCIVISIFCVILRL
jgi:hypothetical protein